MCYGVKLKQNVMNKRLFLTICVTLFSLLTALAATIRGKVIDATTQEPLIGATVVDKSKKSGFLGATTDIEGKFTLNVSGDFPITLNISYAGYASTTLEVYEASDDVIIALTENFNNLSGVVVVGYGTQKRANLTSSVSTVNGRSISELSTPTFENALAGQASGINLVVPNGNIGQGPIIRVRGVSSLTSGTQPLYVIDGVPVATDKYSSMNVSNPLSNINQDDIESIDVLKDASAAALYGSRAANGVILVTTKQGKKGKPKISYQGYVNVKSAVDYCRMMDAFQYVDLKNEAVFNRYGRYTLNNYDVNSGTLGGYHVQGEQRAFNLLYDDNGQVVNDNWQDYIYRTAWSTNHNVSVAGGSDDIKYYVSGNYQSINGIIIGNQQNRLLLNANISAKVNKWITLGGRLNLSETMLTDYDSRNNALNEGPGYISWTALNIPSNIPIHFADGSPWVIDGRVGYGPNQTNVAMGPPSAQYETDSKTTQKNVHRFYNFSFEYEPIKHLKFKSQYGKDLSTVEDRSYYAPETSMYKYNGYAANISTQVDQYTWTNLLTYTKDWNTGHHIDLLAGEESYEKTRRSWGAKRYNQADYDYTIYEAAYNDIASIGTQYTEVGMLSYLFRANYDYKSRYIFSFNFRRDGLSSLSRNHRWGNFGGLSAAWKISDEKFFRGFKRYLDDVKIRASWGVVGNTSIAAYASSSTYSSVYNGSASAYIRSQVADENLKWESSSKLDLGISGVLLKKINFDLNYYYTKGADLILAVPTSPSRGVTNNSIISNVGSMYNRGLGLTLTADVIRKHGFNWNTSFNITWNKNKVTSLGSASSIVTNYNITEVGKSIGQLYLYRSGRVDPETGYRIVYDKQGQEVLIKFVNGNTSYEHRDGTTVSTADLDRYAAGNTLPTYYGGWTNTLSYKHFDLSICFQYSGGNKIWNGEKGLLAQYGFRNNTVDVYENYWREDRRDAFYAKPVYGDNISNGNGGLPMDFLVENGDFIRLKSLTLGYNLERLSWLKNVGISSARIYFQATNLLTFTGYSGIDPEVSSATSGSDNAYNLQAGIDENAVPQTRSFTLGVNVNF